MTDYEAVIGMEVHAQVLTKSKMFCACSADYASAPPNTHTCPVCLAMPGVLPVINEAAVHATVRTGLALHCVIPEFSRFDRKNYNYPDLPKGYQISQYDYPFCQNGYLEIETDEGPKRVRIRRVHLEEDAAKLVHEGDSSLVDFNRAGIPLMEIVSESDIRSGAEAHAYLTELRTILRYIGVSTGNMEDGAMRCEANVSVRPRGAQAYGTKVEVKNLNSFRSVRLAIAYEIERQIGLLESGGTVKQVTMGWDENRQETVFQRSKEEAEDYRYFPEPDLPPLFLKRQWVAELEAGLPEMPAARRTRYTEIYGLRPEDAALLATDSAVSDFYDACVHVAGDNPSAASLAHWVLGEVFRLSGDTCTALGDSKLTPESLVEVVSLVEKGTINATMGKELLDEIYAQGGSPSAIVEQRGLSQISDEDALASLVAQVIADNPKATQDLAGGKGAALGFLIGQVMRATKGKANAKVVQAMLRDRLSGASDT